MEKGENIAAILLCILGLFILYESSQIPTMVAVEKSSVINARFFPQLMSAMLVVMGGILLIENYLSRKKRKMIPADKTKNSYIESNQKNKTLSKSNSWLRLGGVILLCCIFVVAYDPIGFLISSTFFMLIFLLLVGVRNWLTLILVSLLPTLCVYLSFKMLIGVPLPEGLLSL